MQTKPKVLIGMVSYSGLIPAMTTMSLFHLNRPCETGFMLVTGIMVTFARNVIAEYAIKHDWDYVLYLDDDNPFPKDTLEKFLEDDKDIVAAPILTRRLNKNGKYELCVFYSEENNGARFFNRIEKFRDEGYLHRVDGCGMGCTLIKTGVLKALNGQYGQEVFEWTTILLSDPAEHNGKKIIRQKVGEDCMFCERAVDAGFEIWCDTRIRPLHLGDPISTQYEE